jgi:hypothetical protein
MCTGDGTGNCQIIDDGTNKASHDLSGGLMVLSAKRGRDRNKLDKGRFISNFKIGRELVECFRQEFGAISCEGLQQQFTAHRYNM